MDIETQIRENAASITARYQRHVSIARYFFLMLFAVLVVLIFKSEISTLIQPPLKLQNPSSTVINNFMVQVLSGSLNAQQRLSQGIKNLPIDLSDQSLSEAEKLELIADYLSSNSQGVYPRELTGDATIPKYNADKEITPIVVSPENVVAESLFSEPITPIIEIESSRIFLYSSADEDRQIISSVKNLRQLRIQENIGDWTRVSLVDGIPVWVKKPQIEKYAKGYARITSAKVSAYSGPSSLDSAVVGVLDKDDVLRLIRRQGEWYRVWSPISFTAWVKTTDLNVIY